MTRKEARLYAMLVGCTIEDEDDLRDNGGVWFWHPEDTGHNALNLPTVTWIENGGIVEYYNPDTVEWELVSPPNKKKT